MQINTKYELGQTIWVVYENRGEVCLYTDEIIEISLVKDGLVYITSACEEVSESDIILENEKDKLFDKMTKLMQEIKEKEERRLSL